MTRAFAASIATLDGIIADQRAKSLADRAVLERGGPGWAASDPERDDEFAPVGFGRTREAALADLIERCADEDDIGPELTPEQIAADNARIRAEDDWIEPGGWDEEDGQPDEAQEWADYDRDC